MHDASIQTSSALTARTPRKENLRRKLKRVLYDNEKLDNAVKRLRKEESEEQVLENITFDQYKKLTLKFCPSVELANCIIAVLSQLNKNPKGRRYSEDFKNVCLSLYFVGPKLYKNILVNKCGFPCVRTLQRFICHIKISAGFNNDFIFQSIQKKVSGFRDIDKLCILCVDEMNIKANLFYGLDVDKITGFEDFGNGQRNFKPALSVAVIMARGLTKKWKQPIGFVFLNSMCPGKQLKEIICNVVSRLHQIDLKVIGIVSDMGTNNIQMSKLLGVTSECPYFYHEDNKIVYLFDTPHLLKSVRNNLLKHRFEIDGNIVSWEFIERFYQHDQKYSVRAAPKLTESHIKPNSFEKMKVRYASQIFSNSVAAGLNVYIRFGKLPQDACTTQQFISTMNNLFDILNSSNIIGATEYQHAYKGSDYQQNFLQECFNTFNKLIVRNWKGENITKAVKCIQGWKITINGFIHLWDILKSKEMEFLFTRRVQQDCLENFFGSVRQENGNCVNPTPIQFIRTFRKLFCIKLLNSGYENCEEDASNILLKIGDISKISQTVEEESRSILEKSECTDVTINDSDYKSYDLLQKNFLRYIAGYLIKKCLMKHNCLVCQEYANEFNTLDDTSIYCNLRAYQPSNTAIFGGLKMPNTSFVYLVSSLETIFQQNFEVLAIGNNIVEKFVTLFKTVNFAHPCPKFTVLYLYNLYARVRIYYTLKDINKNFKLPNRNRKLIIWKNA